MKDIINKFKQNEDLNESEQDLLLQQLMMGQKRQQLNNIREEALRMMVVKPNNYRMWAMAASILFVVSVGGWFFMQNQTPQYVKLTDSYLSENEPYGSTKLGGAGVTIEENEAQAKMAYAQADYTKSGDFLSKIVEMGKATPEHHYFLALSRMRQKQPDFPTAITHLLEARRISPTWKEFDINWYLGIAYSRIHEFALARTELQKNIGNSRTKEVEKLLAELPK